MVVLIDIYDISIVEVFNKDINTENDFEKCPNIEEDNMERIIMLVLETNICNTNNSPMIVVEGFMIKRRNLWNC